MNDTRKEKDMSIAILLELLDSIPLHAHYKIDHLMNKLADLSADVKPVPLNAVNFQTTFMTSADVLPWHPDDDPGYQNRECQVKRIKVNTSKITLDIYPDSFLENKPVCLC